MLLSLFLLAAVVSFHPLEPSGDSGADGVFVERAVELGLVHEHLSGLDRVGLQTGMLDWAQSGIALGDLDGDTDLDVVACGGLLPTHVFIRGAAGVWRDATRKSGLMSSELYRVPAVGDYDRDGDLDLFLGALDHGDGPTEGRSRLYRNSGAATFEDVTALSGTVGHGHTLHAKWIDLDRDGLLDLLTGEFHGTPNAAYINAGDGSFIERGAALGLDNAGSAHVVGVVDTDVDAALDVFVANDFVVSVNMDLASNSPNVQLTEQPDGTFADVTSGSGFGLNATTMGLAFGDVNYDGLLDVYQTEYEENFLQLNGGWPSTAGAWINAAWGYGVVCNSVPIAGGLPGEIGIAVGWGTTFAHLDFDPWIDLVVVNGHVGGGDPRDQQNFLYRGGGPQTGFTFVDATAELGFDEPIDDRALAVGDADGDGDLDLFVGGLASRLRYYENRLERTGGSVRVEARCATSAPGANGVRVEWYDSEERPHVQVIGSESPAASQNEHAAFFGLGSEAAVDLRVSYPSGIVREYASVAADSVLVSSEPQLIAVPSRTAWVDAAGAEWTVTAWAHDASGAPLGPAAEVEIDVDGLSPAGPVVHVAGNRFERTYFLPGTPGVHRVRVRFDDFEVGVRPRLIVFDSQDLDVGMSLSPMSVRAGTTDTARLEITPRGSIPGTWRAAFGPGLDLAVRWGGSVLPLEDLGDGRYAASLEAPDDPGHYSLDIFGLPGGPYRAGQALEVAGPADASATRGYVEVPHWDVAASPHVQHGVVTPRDAMGARLGPRAGFRVVVLEDETSEPVSVLPAPRQAQDDGEFVFSLGRPPHSPAGSASGLVHVYVDQVLVWTSPFEF